MPEQTPVGCGDGRFGNLTGGFSSGSERAAPWHKLVRTGRKARLMPVGYKARAERVMLFADFAWNANCSRHVPTRIDAAHVTAALAERDQRIEGLEGENEPVRSTARQGFP